MFQNFCPWANFLLSDVPSTEATLTLDGRTSQLVICQTIQTHTVREPYNGTIVCAWNPSNPSAVYHMDISSTDVNISFTGTNPSNSLDLQNLVTGTYNIQCTAVHELKNSTVCYTLKVLGMYYIMTVIHSRCCAGIVEWLLFTLCDRYVLYNDCYSLYIMISRYYTMIVIHSTW